MPRNSLRRSVTILAAVTATVTSLLVVPVVAAGPAGAAVDTAPGAPGTESRFDLARKDCVGTARNTGSKVWFTVADGVLSDVYEPTIDNTNVQSLQFVVTDGASFTDLQTRDTSYRVRTDSTGMQCTVTSRSAKHHYRLVTTFFTDPRRDTVLIRTRLIGTAHLRVFARLDAHVNGNGGGGTANGGADSAVVTADGVPVIGDDNTVSQAVNRDYAVPTYMALDATSLRQSSVGYEGSASDGLTQLDAQHALSQRWANAPDGHVVATANVTPRRGEAFTLALGFGRNESAAARTARASLGTRAATLASQYIEGWRHYDGSLVRPKEHRHAYYLSANVLKASVDKSFSGALVASLSSPWGQAVSAATLTGGKPAYFGSYREVFARDLYEGVTGFIADGDLGEARAATRFLLLRQQQANGEMPRNSLLNGKVAPDTGGDQLDETAYPILMAYLTGLSSRTALYREHIIPAADFLVAHGPSFGVERWEEQPGYSPSTIAAEIAGLTAAAKIAAVQGDSSHAQLYQAVADDFQRTVKAHTVTTKGPYSNSPYFIRLSPNGDPDADVTYNLGNGSINVDQKAVVDGGFQDLVRLGELPANDPDVINSLKVIDKQIAVTTPTGTGYYRYGTDAAAGSADGYGDCYVPDQTSCTTNGEPWPTTDTGSGHLWPVLSGERAETALAQGDSSLASSQLSFMLKSAAGEGLVPEQVWEDPGLAASPYGSDPTTASIGFEDGRPAGSASPLTWAQAQELRLITDLGKGRITDRPDITTQRYVTHTPPANVPVTITAPTAATQVSDTTTVTGTTTSGATVVVSSIGTDVTGSAATVSTTADSGGNYTANVPVGFGTDVITVAATTPDGTGVARVSVVGQLVGGTSVLDVTDPTGDDDGPGTYQYPTAADFVPGSFDITRFQVLTKDGTVYLRTTLRTLTPTFGNDLGAQLFDLYVHVPGKSPTSTAAAFASRKYQIAPADAWNQRLEVQGFSAPVWVDAAGDQVGTAAVVTSTSAKTMTIAVPEAQFGTPSTGWSFVEALTGQDGTPGGADQARIFTATPGAYTFGVCAVGGTAAICSSGPDTVPKVMDTLTPPDVAQSDELDPTKGTVVLHGVAVS